MERQLQHTHGRHYDEQDTLNAGGHHTGHDYNEDEHHGEKKSVIKKVKAKAKKLKDTITKHGHGHGGHEHHDEEEEEDDDEETVDDPEVHGAPMYDSAAVRIGLGGPDAVLTRPRGTLERPSVAEDRYTPSSDVVEQDGRHGAPPPVSTGPYGTNLSEPPGHGHHQAYGQEVNPEQWRGKTGQPTGMEEGHFNPNPAGVGSPSGHTTDATDPTRGTTHVSIPVGPHGYGQDVNRQELMGRIGKSTGLVEDPHTPKDPSSVELDPSNYETKVSHPTHTGGKEAEMSQIRSLEKMGIHDEQDPGSHGQFAPEPKFFDPNHPENLPQDTLDGNPSSRTSSYGDKISSATSAIAEKAAVAKDVIASKLGYSVENPSGSGETVEKSGFATEYAHKISDTVTGTLAPVYEKIVDAGTSVMSKMQGSGTGSGQEEVERRSDTSSGTGTVERRKVADKGVSVKEYLVETLRPRDEDKTLSEVITHAFHRGKDGEPGKKSVEDRRPMGRVTESEEVRRRLGSDHRDEQQLQEHSGNVSADKGVGERLRDAVGSWFGGKGTGAPQGSLGTSYVTDEGLSSSPGGDQKGGTAREQ